MTRSSDMTERQPSAEELRLLDLLYGELDGDAAATARAEADADPERSAELEAFGQLRELMRELPDEEPPAAITAQLMHAAARARPSAAPAAVAGVGLWARLRAWFRPVMMHPAMAAAATFVLVAGVAGTLYLTGNFGAAEPRTRSAATPPASRAADRQHESVPAGEGRAPAAGDVGGIMDLPTTPSGDDIVVDGTELADKQAEAESQLGKQEKKAPAAHRAGNSGGSATLDPYGPSGGKPRTRDTASTGEAGGAAAPADNRPATTAGSAGDRDMIEADDEAAPEEAPARPAPAKPVPKVPSKETTGKAPAPDTKPVFEQPAPQAPPPPPPAPAQQQKPKDSSNEASRAQINDLHGKALQAAADNECDAVISLGKRIAAIDASYYKTRYLTDKRLTKCLAKK